MTLFRRDTSSETGEDRMAQSMKTLTIGLGVLALAVLGVAAAGGWFLVLRPLLHWYGSR